MKNLKELIAINSFENKDAIIEYLKRKFQPFAIEVIVLKNKEDDDKSLIVGLNTKLKDVQPIVLSGHIDTVAPDYKKYQTNPLELILKDGKGYGLGSVDMKSFTAVILDNIEKLRNIDMPIVVALTTDEETKLKCIKNVICKFKELNILPKFTIVGEPTNCQIKNEANCGFEYKVEIFGKACHSSRINEGINSINIMAKLVTFIEEIQKNIDLTSNSGVVSGGDIVNRVPDYCTFRFDIRSTKKAAINQFLTAVRDKIEMLQKEYKGCQIVLTKKLEIPPLEEKNKDLITKIAKELGLKISKFSGGCEAGFYQSLSGDAIIFGVGDIDLAHKPNEFVVIDEYKKYSDLLLKMIDKL